MSSKQGFEDRDTFDFFGKLYVKLKRIKAFYQAKVSKDLGFLAEGPVSVEEGEDEELFGVSPSSSQSHFVNRIDEAARSMSRGETGHELFSEGFLEYSVPVEEKQNQWEFSFDCSMESISNAAADEESISEKGFLKLNTIDHKLKQGSRVKEQSRAIPRTRSNKLEFKDDIGRVEGPNEAFSGQKKAKHVPDFIGFSEIQSEPKENKRSNNPKACPDFENIFNEGKYKNIDSRNNKLEFVSRERIRKSTKLFNEFASLPRNKKTISNQVRHSTNLKGVSDNSASLLPEFDNSTRRRVPARNTRETSIDFLI